MKEYKGVVFFDYDGTLIDEVDGIFELPDSAKEALTKLRENGYATCICSGRTKLFSEQVKDYFDGYVTGQGAHVEIDEHVIFSPAISTETLMEMSRVCTERGITILMDGANQSYCDHMESEEYKFFDYVFHVQDGWIIPWSEEHKEPVNKLTFMYRTEEDYDFLIDYLGDRYEYGKHIRYNFLDVTPKGADKGTGIIAMMEYLKLPMEASYAFCDGDNDMPMVKTAKTSVIMGRHYAGLEPYAAYITDTVKNDGIKKGLEHLGLI